MGGFVADDPTFDDLLRKERLLLQDPLSKVSRQERTRLLLSSMCGLVVAKAGIIPNKVESLGIEFTSSNRKAMAVLLAVVVLYFLLAFVIYSFFDILLAFLGAGAANTQYVSEFKKKYPGETSDRTLTTRVLFLLRASLFEFGLPVTVGIYAVVCLMRAMGTF
jgi:hypothetical protein